MRIVLMGILLALWTAPAAATAQTAQTTPTWTPAEGDYVGGPLVTTSGATLPELKIHYRTLGQPVRDASGRVTNAVLLLHGTGGTGAQFLSPQFATELFGPGQPLDTTRYFIIMPDNLGHGRSSKPSDGLRARFPEYGYADMVEAQRRMLVEGLKVDRLRLILGTSMGCMHAFVWGFVQDEYGVQGAVDGAEVDAAYASGARARPVTTAAPVTRVRERRARREWCVMKASVSKGQTATPHTPPRWLTWA